MPHRPPDAPSAFRRLATERPDLLLRIADPSLRAEVDVRYPHWDDLRHRRPPPGLDHLQWWTLVRTMRTVSASTLPLADPAGRAFTFSRSDVLVRALHLADRALGTSHLVADPRTTRIDKRDAFLVQSMREEEAISSSLIEGAATTRRVASEMLREGRAPRTTGEQMIANNYRALGFIRDRVPDALTPELLLELQRILGTGTMQPGDVGRFRRADENVIVHERATGEVLHVPPPASGLPGRLERLCAFANATDSETFLHPVVRAITLHFMLGYEHPFVDGNGRTARAVFLWSMLRSGYWLTEYLAISTVIHKAPGQYQRAFLHTETDDGDLTYFLLHQLDVIQKSWARFEAFVARTRAELREADEALHRRIDLNERQRAVVAEALRHPDRTFRIETHQRDFDVAYATARADLYGLEAAKLLSRKKAGRAFVFTATPALLRRGTSPARKH